jgi:penicillin-binding protein 1A
VQPAGIETKQIDIGTGKLASDWCGPSRREFFVRGSAPKESCENDPYLAMRDAEPPDWHDRTNEGSGEIDPAQIAEAVGSVLESIGGNAKARAAADRIISELRKAQRHAAREVKREADRVRRERD